MLKEKLADLLTFYFREDIPRWSSDNDGEVYEMAELVERIAEEKVKEKLEEAFERGLDAIRRKPAPEEITYHTLMRKAWELAGKPDDAGCDWLTDEEGNTYIAHADWKVSDDPQVAVLVEAAYFIRFGENVRKTMSEIREMLEEAE